MEITLNSKRDNYFTAFFHDGSITHIQHENENICITLESAEMKKEDLRDCNIRLNSEPFLQLKGVLVLESVRSVELNDALQSEDISMLDDECNVIRFDFFENKVEFFVEWYHFPVEINAQKYMSISIEFDKAKWINFE
jgi:hypothetical protein